MPPRGRSRRSKSADDATRGPANAAEATATVARGIPAQSHRRRLLLGAALLAVALAIGLRCFQLANDPRVFFLANEEGAEWIRAPAPFSMGLYPDVQPVTIFETTFTTTTPVSDARLTVRAFRRAAVALDTALIDRGAKDFGDWKEPRSLALPNPLPAGRHVLRIVVTNRDAVCCLLAYCPQLGIRTGPGWEATPSRQPTAPAAAAADVRLPEMVGEFPRVVQAIRGVAPWLAAIFCLSFLWTVWSRRGWRLSPTLLRWVLIAAWIALAANNIGKVPPDIGYDVAAHYEYIEYIVHARSLPLATQGWQMFQPPLFYLLAAPWFALFRSHFDDEFVVKALRFLPLLCGLAQIEIAFRAARAAFPEKEDLQAIALTVAGLMPMQIYISMVIGNEPLAGCLTAAVVLMCFLLLAEPTRPRRPRFFVGLGFLWGLALLSKVTPVLLAPLVALVVIWQGRQEARPSVAAKPQRNRKETRADGGTWGRGLMRLGIVVAACGVTAGWFFVRNWIYLGRPVIFGGTPESGFFWWQDPSYRTWNQLTRFGTALVHPVYSGCWSLWDSLYSTQWLDGFVSGTSTIPKGVPWNLHWMEAGSWLGLVPVGLMLCGALGSWRSGPRAILIFAVAAIATYIAAIVDLYVRLPIYSTAKATYSLGLLPCYAVLAAAGAAPFVRFRIPRAILFAALSCWAVAAYAAYFIV
jgi:Dolichyl-phosphate-mannose-protein mannosyltransferase